MSGDDPRHGTHAGHQLHRSSRETPCRPCKDAYNAYRRAIRKPSSDNRRMVNYIESGYDPNDGLIDGRWMRDTWGVVRWVPIPPPPAPITEVPATSCSDCGSPVSRKSARCAPCHLERVRLTSDRYARYAEGAA